MVASVRITVQDTIPSTDLRRLNRIPMFIGKRTAEHAKTG